MKTKLCRDIECEPPYGGKEACELYQDGICSALPTIVFVTNITKDENTYVGTHMGHEIWLHHVVCDCTVPGGETEKQVYRIFTPEEYADVMSKGYYQIPEYDPSPED